jgi:hypothetical protein
VSVTPVLRDQDVTVASRGRVLVLGGSGAGAWLVRRLVLEGYEVCMAAVATGDTDDAVAEVLGVERVALPPFGAMDEDAERAVTDLASGADAIVVSRTPFGRANVANLRAVTRASAPTVLVGTIEERDFTGGEASTLWEKAATTATVVPDEEAAVRTIQEVTGG